MKNTEKANKEKKEEPKTKNTKSEISSVHNLIIVDESGSMDSCINATLSGFNETLSTILNSVKKDPDRKQYISFATFNSERLKTHCWRAEVSSVKKLKASDYNPSGLTPLFDAIGTCVNRLHYEIKSEKVPDHKIVVLVTIITDGLENDSREYNLGDIRSLINKLSGKNWIFTYLGANHIVEEVALKMSINNYESFVSDEDGSKKMYQNLNEKRERFYKKIAENEKVDNLKEGFFKKE